MDDTLTDDRFRAVLDAEFPNPHPAHVADFGYNLDTECIRADLVDTIALAMGMPADFDEDGHRIGYDDDEDDAWLDEASRVLAALVERGVVRRDDFGYSDETHTLFRL